jgi:hypothetical protein
MTTIPFELARIEDEELRNQAVELWIAGLSEQERQEVEANLRRLLVNTEFVLTSLAEHLRPVVEVIGEWLVCNPEVKAYLETLGTEPKL